jgi:hypothetical protein
LGRNSFEKEIIKGLSSKSRKSCRFRIRIRIEIEKVLSLPYKDPDADEALYYKALIYAHYNNPDKDYKKSRELLKNLLQEHPQSPFTEQVKIWLGVLDVIEKAKQVDIEIEEKMKKLNR